MRARGAENVCVAVLAAAASMYTRCRCGRTQYTRLCVRASKCGQRVCAEAVRNDADARRDAGSERGACARALETNERERAGERVCVCVCAYGLCAKLGDVLLWRTQSIAIVCVCVCVLYAAYMLRDDDGV